MTKLLHHYLASIFAFSALVFLLQSCTEDNYFPKPRGYPRVELPNHAYQSYQPDNCPFQFEHPTYANIINDPSLLIGGRKVPPPNACWMDVDFKDLNAKIHLSYKDMSKQGDNLGKLIEDAYKMNSKHVMKADYMEDSAFITKNGVFGIFYEIGGDAATSTQFFVTDSINHFVWASLYFSSPPNEDSIAPMVNFIRKDIDQMINSFEWKE
ncbi:MAG: hypothetical protein ACPGXL_05715 [Chitinophagales bacterium]